MTRLPTAWSLILHLVAIIAQASSSSECVSSGGGSGGEQCPDGDGDDDGGGCLDAAALQRRVASLERDGSSMLSSLRGTVDDLLSPDDAHALAESLPAGEFVEASGYDGGNDGDHRARDVRAYNAPVAYAGLGLRDLSSASSGSRSRYERILELREAVREASERSLGLCPGALLVDYTAISQKTEGGAHRPHADKCVHYFDEAGGATCDPGRVHPYPHRVAASILYLNDHAGGNFSDGEFYFADRSNGGVEETVPMKSGRMVYFTSGVENLHGALQVQRRDNSGGAPPRRLALAMWYVTDPELEEYVPPFRGAAETLPPPSNDDDATTTLGMKPRGRHDPNDPDAPKFLFDVPLPKKRVDDVPSLFDSVGSYLAKRISSASWKMIRDEAVKNKLYLLFKDNTAMFSLDFGVGPDLDENGAYSGSFIVAERHTDGKRPASLQYMLQESVMLHSALDALWGSMGGDDGDWMDEDERQYIGVHVEKARGTLPARRA